MAAKRTRRGVVGVDVGTAAVRAVVHDADDGALLAETSEPLRVLGRGGAREVDFDHAWTSVDASFDRLAALLDGQRVEVRNVGIATTASTVATFDGDLRPTARGLLWADHRAMTEAAEIAATRHAVLDRTVGYVSPEWGLPKLLHLWRAAGRRRAKPRYVLELLDWLDWKLTRGLVANAGIREWGWCVADDGRWPDELVDAARLGDALELVVPDTAVTGEPLGTVADDVARRHPILRGATVTMGGMDSYMAAHGQGVSVPGRLAATFGSSSSLIAGESTGDARGWLYGPMRRILPGPSAYWQGGQSTAGLALDAVARVAGRTWRELEPPAAAIPPGSDGLVFRETLLDRRAPWPRAGMRGVFDGLSLAHGTGHLGRAALEGVVFGARLAARPLSPDEIVITGGLAESPLFRDVLATAMKRRVGTLRHRSAAAFGAAFAHATDDVASLNPVVSWTEPSPADPAFEWAFERYVRLHNLPASVGEVAAPEERRAA